MKVRNKANIYDNAIIYGSVVIQDAVIISGDARLFGHACIRGKTIISGNAQVSENAVLTVDDVIYTGRFEYNAHVCDSDDYMIIDSIGSRHDTTTFYRGNDDTIYTVTGCFNDTLEEFKKKLKDSCDGNNYNKEYELVIELAELHIFKKGSDTDGKEI